MQLGTDVEALHDAEFRLGLGAIGEPQVLQAEVGDRRRVDAGGEGADHVAQRQPLRRADGQAIEDDPRWCQAALQMDGDRQVGRADHQLSAHSQLDVDALGRGGLDRHVEGQPVDVQRAQAEGILPVVHRAAEGEFDAGRAGGRGDAGADHQRQLVVAVAVDRAVGGGVGARRLVGSLYAERDVAAHADGDVATLGGDAHADDARFDEVVVGTLHGRQGDLECEHRAAEQRQRAGDDERPVHRDADLTQGVLHVTIEGDRGAHAEPLIDLQE